MAKSHSTVSTHSHAAQSVMARILATENIRVVVDPKMNTAAFDLKNRTLLLPQWKDMSKTVYDMLIGHEISHALHTPAEGWRETCNTISGTTDHNSTAWQTASLYLNVVEDARIERLIQIKFPGFRRDFIAAYADLNAKNFFGVKGMDLNTLTLADRINLYYKLGTIGAVGIRFTADEDVFIRRIDAAQSFDDAAQIAEDLFKFCREQQQQKQNQPPQKGTPTPGNNDAGMSGESQESDGDGDESQQGNSDGDGENESKSDGSGSAAPQGDSEESKQPSGGGRGSAPASNTTDPAPTPMTQQKFNENLSNNTDRATNDWDKSVTTPTVLTFPDIDRVVVDCKEILAAARTDIRAVFNPTDARDVELMKRVDAVNEKFFRDSKRQIDLLVKQFELRKAAAIAKRESVRKTGVLDTVRMVNYKITDDIFRRNTTIREGKNHGLVMFIDWSGSMSTTLMDTVKQLMQIALFCRRCNIPFEVYAFSTVVVKNNKDGKVDMYDGTHCWNREGDKVARFHNFTLFNFLSSKMRPNQFKQAIVNLFAITLVNNGEWTQYNAMPDCFGLSSTPLDESILAAMDIVPKFREDNRLQIVHTVFLTDGETSGSGLYNSGYYSRNFVTDPVTRKTYEISRRSTDTLLEIFRDRTKCNAIGFFLLGRGRPERYSHLFTPHAVDPKSNVMRVVSNLSQKDVDYRLKQYDSFKSDGFAIAHPTATGYTEQFIVRADVKIDDSDDMAKVSADSSMTQIKNAFIRNANKRMKTRVMLNRFIDLIAK